MMRTSTSEHMGIVTTKIFPWLADDADNYAAAFAAHVAVSNGQIYINAAPNNMTPDEAQQLVNAINQAIAIAKAFTL